MADWDDENFDVDAGFADDGPGDKWDGEDEEEVKDNWEDDFDEKKPAAAAAVSAESEDVKAFQVQKKKPISERIREKEEEKQIKASEKLKNEEEKKELTPAEIQAEKARQQQIQEEADLVLAKEMFAMSTTAGPSIDTMKPNTKEEFEEFAKLLKEKILQFEKSPHFSELLEDVLPGVSTGLDAEVLKRIGSSLTAIGNEKSKQQKATKGGKKKKKAALVGGGKSGRRDEFDDYGGDEYDDFM